MQAYTIVEMEYWKFLLEKIPHIPLYVLRMIELCIELQSVYVCVREFPIE